MGPTSPRPGFRRFFFLIQNPLQGTHPYVHSYHFGIPYYEELYCTYVQSDNTTLRKRQIEQWLVNVPVGANISVVFADLPEQWLNPELLKPKELK